MLLLSRDARLSRCKLRLGPVGVNYFASLFPMAQIICISNFRSLSLIVNILWLFEKYTLGNVTTLVTTLQLSF